MWAAEPDHPFEGGSLRILPSRGAHLVVPRERIPNTTGLTIRVPGKIVFLVPWPDHWLIGTTDAPFDGPAARPSAAGWEVDRLLDTVNATMDVDLTRADVVGTYAGLRPLIAPSDGSTVKASREHRVTVGSERRRPDRWRQVHDVPGDGARRDRCGPRTGRARAPERHRRAPAGRGAPTRTPWRASPAELATIAAVRDVGPEAAARLVARHGTEAPGVVALGAELDLIRPLVPGRPFLEAEVAWAVRHELAARSTTSSRAGRGSPRSCPTGALRSRRGSRRSWAADLGWGGARQALEVENYLAVGAPRVLRARRGRRRTGATAAVARDVTPAAVD